MMTSDKEKKDRTGKLLLNEALHKNRREVLRWGAAGLLGALATNQVEGAQVRRVKFKVLGENDRIDIGDRAKEILEKAYNLGHEVEKKHGGCARCTVAALQGSIDFAGKNKALSQADSQGLRAI